MPDKTERILTLTATLLDTTRPLTAEEIRERMAAYYTGGDASFHRAFERDKDELRTMGIPVRLERIAYTDPPTDGYRIARDDYFLRDPGLEPDELAAINVALTAIELEGAPSVETLWKLGGVVEGGTETLTSLPSDPRLAELFGAVIERATVSFVYGDEERTVDPYRLEFRRGRWYLVGRDHQREALRVFRLDRFTGGVSAGPAAAFTVPPDAARADIDRPWTFGDGEAVTARLRVEGPHVALATRYLGEECLVAEVGDAAEFEVEVLHWPGFRSFVLDQLEHAEVLGPPELRTALRDWLADVVAAGEPA